jgi:hypothetical protein
MFEKRTDHQIDERMKHRMAKKGLPAKYAKMGFKKGWAAYKKSNPGMVSMVRTLAGSKKRKKRRKSMGGIGAEPYFGKSKKRRKSSGARAMRQLVITMPKKRRSKSMRGESVDFSGSGRGGNSTKQMMANLMPILIGTGGAVAGNVAANLIPGLNPKIKAALPFALGCGLAIFGGNNPIIRGLAYGMGIGGGLSLVRTFAGPSIPLLAGEEPSTAITEGDVEQALIEGKISPAEAAAILPHRAPELMGIAESYGYEGENAPYGETQPGETFLTTEAAS